MVAVGVTVILLVVCPPGFQLNDPPLGEAVAESVTEEPGQKVTAGTLTVGLGATVTVPDALAEEQPFNVYTTL